ncbi:MAG: AAA family ATPase [Alphaproteobacteria bacterium]|nr:AAA family ATPase [Alphaproteobacteria bacterium]
MSADAPLTLGPFVLAERIGQGGMAEVWRARIRGEEDGAPVAVKVLTARRVGDRRFLGSFREEVRAVARLDHPAIIRIHDHGEVEPAAARHSDGQLAAGSPWLAMELVEGGTLGQQPPTDWAGLRRVLLQLLDALAHAHARGLVHRDLKPANVLCSPDGLRLTDFGAVQDRDWLQLRVGRGEAPDAVFGTVAYMPPEQVRGDWRDQGPWTDLYALGAVAWRLCTGAPPFLGEPREVLRQHCLSVPGAFRPLFPVPEGFEAWLRVLLDKDPRVRFPRAADAAWALVQLLDQPVGPALPPAPLEALPTWATFSSGSPPPALTGTETVVLDAVAGLPAPQTSTATGHRAPPLPGTWRGPDRPRPPVAARVGLGLFGLRTVPLVGREAERDLLWEAFAQVAEQSRTGCVVITGEAGHGKSRLAEAVATRLDEVGAAVVLRAFHGTIEGEGDGIAPMLARHLATVGLQSEELRRRVARVLRGDEALVGAVAGLIDPTGSRQGPAERRGVTMELLAREARSRPVVVVLDDLHHAPDAAALVQGCLDRWQAHGPRILFLCTSRLPASAPHVPALLARPGVQHLPIDPLDRTDAGALVTGLLPLAPALADTVVRRADGNPLFAVQLVGDWVARAVLQPADQGWDLRPDAHAPLPDDIHALWEDRLHELLRQAGPDDRESLELAAVLGRTFAPLEWIRACTDRGLLPGRDLLDTLVRAGLAERRSEGGLSSVTLSHALLVESLLRAAAEQERLVGLHASCARALAPHVRGPVPAAARLAHHAVAGGLDVLSARALFDHARLRFREGDFERSLALLDQREAVLDRMGVPVLDRRRLSAEAMRCEALQLYQDAEVAYARGRAMIEAARRLGDPVTLGETLMAHANSARAIGRVDEGVGLLREAVAVMDGATVTEADDELHVGSRRLLGDMLCAAGQLDEALEIARSARAMGGAAELPWNRGSLSSLVGRIEQLRGNLAVAEEHALLAQDSHAESGDLFREATDWNLIGEIRRARQDLDGAAQAYEQASRCFLLAGTRGDMVTRLNLGMVHVLRGELEAARQAAEWSLRLSRESARAIIGTYARAVRAVPAAAAGQWVLLAEDLAELQTAVEQHGIADPDLALCLRLAGEHARGRRPATATAAWKLSAFVYDRLGQTAERDAVRALLDGLRPPAT